MKARKGITHSASFKLLAGFFITILCGSILLSLPFSHKEGVTISFLDALFVSTSAVCVTGLTPVVLRDTYSVGGCVVITVLMQIGGLGFAAFAGALLLIMKQNFRGTLLKESYGVTNSRIKSLIIIIAFSSLFFELVGFILLFIFLLPYYSPLDAIGYAIFHTISAFNNAGLDLFGTSLEAFSSHVGINLTVALLIITGGIGFVVYLDIEENRKKKIKKLSIQTKVVLITTATLIIVGTLLFYCSGDMSLLQSFFQSVTSRTAGFDTIPQVSLSGYSQFLTIVLMFIGASPGSTGGGIKTTTFFTLAVTFYAIIRQKSPTCFRRRIAETSVRKAQAVLMISLAIVLIFTLAILRIEEHTGVAPLAILFEVVSAFATVGLSASITPLLSVTSRILLIILMFVGRVGPLTVTSLLERKKENLNYVEETMNIG